MLILIFLLLFLAGTVIALIFSADALLKTLRTGLPYVTTPNWAIAWLTDNLNLQSSDLVYELGCGDARVITALARKYPEAKFIGIEIQWWPYFLAKWRATKIKNLTIIHGDIYKHDLASATLVYGFYITNFVQKLSAYLEKSLRPGTRVISFGFHLENFRLVQDVPSPTAKGSHLLLYQR